MKVTHIEKYHRRKKQKRSFKIPTPVIYILLVAVGLYFFIHSPFFNINNINITGNRLVPTEQILNLSQINPGENLMEIKKEEVIQKISVHPLIKNVQINRQLPDSLEIIIEERTPIGLLVCPDGFIQVSEEGYFLALVQDLGNYNLPVISGINLDQLPGPGQIIENKGLFTALDIIKKSGPSLLKNIVEFNVDNKNNILAYTVQGIEIRLGGIDNIKEKLNDLNQILQDLVNKQIPENSIEYIDLRFTGPPVIKKKS